MRGLSFRTIETVATETLAMRATSRRLTDFPPRAPVLRPRAVARGIAEAGSAPVGLISVLEGGLMRLALLRATRSSERTPTRAPGRLLTDLLKQFNNPMNGCNRKA